MRYTKYILILIILVGLFGPVVKMNAQGTTTSLINPSLSNPPATNNSVIPNNLYNGLASPTSVPCTGTNLDGTPMPTGCSYNTTPTPTPAPAPTTGYQLLAPLPSSNGQPITHVDTTAGLGSYLNLMIRIFIGLCAVLSVVMIVIGGLEYMTSELIASKEEGKHRIEEALFGLIIALGAWALLYTINPDLLKSDINIPSTTGTTTGGTPARTSGGLTVGTTSNIALPNTFSGTNPSLINPSLSNPTPTNNNGIPNNLYNGLASPPTGNNP